MGASCHAVRRVRVSRALCRRPLLLSGGAGRGGAKARQGGLRCGRSAAPKVSCAQVFVPQRPQRPKPALVRGWFRLPFRARAEDEVPPVHAKPHGDRRRSAVLPRLALVRHPEALCEVASRVSRAPAGPLHQEDLQGRRPWRKAPPCRAALPFVCCVGCVLRGLDKQAGEGREVH